MSSLNAQQISSLVRQGGFPDAQNPLMTAIVLAESGGRQRAYNPKDLDDSYGLLQINMKGALGPARRKEFGLKSNEDLFDPKINILAGKKIYDSSGPNAWSAYKSGAYKKYLPQAQQAYAKLSTQQANPATSQSPTQQPFPPQSPTSQPNTVVVIGDNQNEEDSKATLGKQFLNAYLGDIINPSKAPAKDSGNLNQALFNNLLNASISGTNRVDYFGKGIL